MIAYANNQHFISKIDKNSHAESMTVIVMIAIITISFGFHILKNFSRINYIQYSI